MTHLDAALMGHVNRLAVDIRPRPIGSPANLAPAHYIRSSFRTAGLEVPNHVFDCPDWTHVETCLELNDERVAAAANAFSQACDVTAPTVAVGTLTELQAVDLTGRIAVFYGELSKEPLAAKGCAVYNPGRDQQIVRWLEEKQPAALITVNLQPAVLTRLVEDWDLAIPSATVPAEAGLKLLQQVGQPAHLRIVSRQAPSRSASIVGRKTGARPERIVLCAHYDTKIETPGAIDNASGVAALLVLVDQLEHKGLAAGLEFIAFSAEEYYGISDTEYVRHSGDELESILVAINMDGVGQRLGTHTIAIMAHSASLQAQVAQQVESYPGVMWVDPWPQSNHSTFAWRGVPSLAFTSTGVSNVTHTLSDTIDWVSAAKLGEIVSLVTDIVDSVQDKSIDWCRASAPAG